MFGLGLVLHARLPTELHLDHILLGDLLGVSPAAFWQMAVIAGLEGPSGCRVEVAG